MYVFHYEPWTDPQYSEQHSCLHCSWDSWSAHSWCQNKALYLIAPAPLNSSNVLTHPQGVFAGNEVTALEGDHERISIMWPNWRELDGMASRYTKTPSHSYRG